MILIEHQYFAPASVWSAFLKEDGICFEKHERFQKSGFRKRCQVLGANGILLLTVPIVGGRSNKALTYDIFIDQNEAWQRSHWRTLESCYNGSPFFYHYRDSLKKLFDEPYQRLWDWNLACFHWIMIQFRRKPCLFFSTEFVKIQPIAIKDLRNIFDVASREIIQMPSYQQVFADSFYNNLSVLDVLFNLGPEAFFYLQNS